MNVEFEKEYLVELYEKGKTDDKKHRFQPEIVNGYLKCVKYSNFFFIILWCNLAWTFYLFRNIHKLPL